MRLVLDVFSDVYDVLRPHAQAEFWNFSSLTPRDDSIYVVGREQARLNHDLMRKRTSDGMRLILSIPKESGSSLFPYIRSYGIEDLIQNQTMLLISGGDMSREWPHIRYDYFLSKSFECLDNQTAQSRTWEIFDQAQKPHTFLFLNGRLRPHRHMLLERWRGSGILDQSIWTCLEGNNIRYLPPRYEVERFRDRVDSHSSGPLIKYHLFGVEWGDAVINPDLYIDTYFSVVTETVHDYPYSFRTEKIWKPIIMGHPWIAIANRGFYRDMRDLGFSTFDKLIDESFDMIENNVERLDRAAEVVEDLVKQDLPGFLAAAKDICKYNQEHYAVMRQRVRQEFPDRFFQFLRDYQWMI